MRLGHVALVGGKGTKYATSPVTYVGHALRKMVIVWTTLGFCGMNVAVAATYPWIVFVGDKPVRDAVRDNVRTGDGEIVPAVSVTDLVRVGLVLSLHEGESSKVSDWLLAGVDEAPEADNDWVIEDGGVAVLLCLFFEKVGC
jgi:hypothetical protein